jgi:nitrogenase-stabilizing/protective protein
MSVLSDLEELSAAEDFFAYLKVDYDPGILRVSRLHILKRMGKYLDRTDFTSACADEVFAKARETLVQAYQDFAASRPIDERVFKVLQDRDPSREKTEAKAPKAFVPLDSLTIIR